MSGTRLEPSSGVCPAHGEPWVVPDAPDGHRRCTFYVPELGVSEDYGCPQTGRETSRSTWCDGTSHSPQALPPLPLHDFRWSGDDPYIECARCGRIERDGRVIVEGRHA